MSIPFVFLYEARSFALTGVLYYHRGHAGHPVSYFPEKALASRFHYLTSQVRA